MVKVAVAGGSGQIAQEIIDALMTSKAHQITIFTRKEAPVAQDDDGIRWQTVNYNDKECLVEALRGTHTLLSFVQILSDPNQTSQKHLIDAAIAAGVKRFAPSEYGSKGTVDMPWWQGKEAIREYLKEVNGNGKVLEYTLFQPGLLLDYLAYPYKTAKYVDPLQTVFDFENRRAIMVDGHGDAVMTLTTAADLASMVARAVEYEGTWPTISGIRGSRVTFSQIIGLGRKRRGPDFTIEKVKIDDLEAGNLNTSWGLEAVHPAVSQEEASALLKAVSIGILLSSSKGAWDVSDELNQLFPDFKFTPIEEFLASAWEGKA